jgi:predicted transcriptional regulator
VEVQKTEKAIDDTYRLCFSFFMSRKPNVGQAEMDILRYIADHHPISVRDVADHIADTKGHVRTTVLNVMERLRKKGYLTRDKVDGLFKYSPSSPKHQMLQGIVGDFVERVLGGSITPFVAYLTERESLSENELGELKELLRCAEEQKQK